MPFQPNFKLGILGAGQLGKMLAQAAADWHLEVHILDASDDFPAAPYATKFTRGDFKNFEDVYNFGKNLEVVTIEIEHINVDALEKLAAEGVKVHPKPSALRIIQDKGLQKQFFEKYQIVSAPYQLFENKSEILKAVAEGKIQFPFVQKTRTAGYDGKGVAIIRCENDLQNLLLGASVVEDLADIDKELSVIVAQNESGECVAFDAVEMDFDPSANLVDLVISPANVTAEIARKAKEIAYHTAKSFDICGVLAVEMFLTRQGEIWVNEVAPRPHNSGHQTIENCFTSQYAQHLRGILNLPLGSTHIIQPARMLNLLGEKNYEGAPIYQGIEKCLALEGVYVHIYGKKTTKPDRKMGHVTIICDNPELLSQKALFVKNNLKVISK